MKAYLLYLFLVVETCLFLVGRDFRCEALEGVRPAGSADLFFGAFFWPLVLPAVVGYDLRDASTCEEKK